MGVGIEPPIAAVTYNGMEHRLATGKHCLATAGKRRVRCSIIPCALRDHVALANFLTEIFGSGYPAEFQAAVENPLYAPHDRLLLRRMGRVIAHVHLTQRIMQFGSLALPVAGLYGLATAPHCRGQGLATHLLLAAERHMAQSGALVGLLRTRIPHFFRRTGWALCGGSSGWAASPHAVLGRLLEQGLGLRRSPRIQVRPWRRWEEDSIARIYRQNMVGNYGMLERSRPYWHWLLERRTYDQVYVALDGPDLWDFKESSTRVVGYAAVKGEKIVELATAPDRRKAAMELLARVCGDAIEQDHRRIALHAPAGSPFWGYFRAPTSPMQGNRCRIPPPARQPSQNLCRRAGPIAPSSAWRGCSIRWGCYRCFAACSSNGLPKPISPGRWNWDCSSTGKSIKLKSPAGPSPGHGRHGGPQLSASQRGRLHAPGARPARLGSGLAGRPRRAFHRRWPMTPAACSSPSCPSGGRYWMTCIGSKAIPPLRRSAATPAPRAAVRCWFARRRTARSSGRAAAYG